MNTRRALFSLFAAAPVGAVAALSLRPIPAEVVRADRAYRCSCNSNLHHFAGTKHVCSWCGEDWNDTR